MSNPAPIAATFASSSIYTFLAPVLSATSFRVSFSSGVILAGQHISTLGFMNSFFDFIFLIN